MTVGTSLPLASHARSMLFVPASRPDRIPKAIASGADLVVVDLEDAVEPAAKPTAREALEAWFAENPTARLLVRVNGCDTDWHDTDLALCARLPGVAGIVLPKADAAADASRVASVKPLWPIIESAAGLAGLSALMRVPGVQRALLGTLDLGVDLGLAPDTEAATILLNQARFQLLLHSRAAGLAAPLDGTHPHIDDLDGLRAHVRRARDMGFAGVGCIHPRQVIEVHQAMAPEPDDVRWARGALAAAAASGAGAFKFEGAMIDAPVLARARQVLARAEPTLRDANAETE